MKRTTKLFIALSIVLGLSVVAGSLAAARNTNALTIRQETASSSAAITKAGSPASLGEYAKGIVNIKLGDQISIAGQGAKVDGDTVKITAAGVYNISGALSDGRIEVDAKGKVYLELNGVDITSSSGPALSIKDAKKVTLTLVQGTTNSLTDKATDSEEDAALYTNDTLVINGGGTLLVTGNDNEGIASDDDILVNAGTLRISAADDGLNAHDDITITGGDVQISAGGDGVDCNGTVHLQGGTLISLGSTGGGEGGIDAIGGLIIDGGTLIAAGNYMTSPSGGSGQVSLYIATGSTHAAGTPVVVTRDGQEVLTFTVDKDFQNILLSSDDLIADAAYDVSVGDGSGAEVHVVATRTHGGPAATAGPTAAAGAPEAIAVFAG